MKVNTSEEISKSKWGKLIEDIGSDELLANINKALNHYNESNHERQYLKDIIDACEQYIKIIPTNRREKGVTKSWEELLPEWPHVIEVLALQKQAVRCLFLPKAETDTKARYKLLKLLILDDQLQSSPSGKMLDKKYWSEFRYQGKLSIADWVSDTDYKHYLRSYNEVVEEESKERGTGQKDIQYLTNNKEYKIDIKDGLLYLNGKLLDTENSKANNRWIEVLFVAGRDGSLYVENSKAKETGKGRFHHSSLLSGKRVLCAGTMKITNGRIQLITNESGHYQPRREDLVNFLTLLKEKHHIDLSPIAVIDSSQSARRSFLDPPPMPKNALRYLNTKGLCLPENRSDMFYEWAISANKYGDSDNLFENLGKAAELGHKKAQEWLGRLKQVEEEKENTEPFHMSLSYS